MGDLNSLKQKLIDRIMDVDDKDRLEKAHDYLLQDPRIRSAKRVEDAVVEIRKGVTLDEIAAEQKTVKLDYEEFKKEAQSIEWEHTFEELMEMLD